MRILCEDYIVCEEPEIIITASDNEIEEESRNNHSPKDYCESICIYRKICREIIKFNCFMLHASLISFDGKGYAFSAPSGYGKSTHARLWRGYFGSRVLILTAISYNKNMTAKIFMLLERLGAEKKMIILILQSY